MRGIGNGVSLLIATGIVINLPMKFYKVFGAFYTSGNELPGLLKYVFYVLMFLIIILLLVIFNESERRIPIQQTGSGLTAKSERVNYLPLKINSAGVIPVIFASALLTAPMTIAEIIKNTSPENGFVKFTEYYLSLNG
jgi:preprotein translocase subunit SecY